MKRFFALLIISLTCMSLLATAAEARRLGGGSSIGKQRTMTPQQTQKAPAAAPAAPAQPATTPQPAGNKWLGPLAGLAIGAGLGALFANLGMSEGMGSLLLIILGGMAILFLIAMLRRPKQQVATQYAGVGAGIPQVRGAKEDTVILTGMPVSGSATSASVPADFPVEAFLRSAKTSFIRLQTANDRKDLNDIREYTTPEMFAEISMQLRERDNAPQQTDVLSLNTDLLEVVNEGDLAIASVRMSGQIRENNGAPENFDEVWHVQKNLKDDKAVWLLSGIQQVA